jgi:hypothetical protein
MAVSFEVGIESGIQVYDQIRARLAAPVVVSAQLRELGRPPARSNNSPSWRRDETGDHQTGRDLRRQTILARFYGAPCTIIC